MKQAHNRTAGEAITQFKRWLDDSIGIFIAERRPGNVIKAWTEQVFTPNEVDGHIAEMAQALVDHFGAIVVEVATNKDGGVKLIRVARDLR